MEDHQQSGRRSSTGLGVKRQAQTVRRPKEAARQREGLEKQKGRLPPGEEISRSACVLQFEHGPFYAKRSSKQNCLNKVFHWGHLWVERSIGKRGGCQYFEDMSGKKVSN